MIEVIYYYDRKHMKRDAGPYGTAAVESAIAPPVSSVRLLQAMRCLWCREP